MSSEVDYIRITLLTQCPHSSIIYLPKYPLHAQLSVNFSQPSAAIKDSFNNTTMTLLSHLRRLPMIISRCKYSPRSCPINCRGRSVLERNIRLLYTSLTIRRPLSLSVPLFHPPSNGFTSLSNTPTQRPYNCSFRCLCSNGNDSKVLYISWDELWDMRFQELVQYRHEHGDTRPSEVC